MLDELKTRLEDMHAAIGDLKDVDLSRAKANFAQIGDWVEWATEMPKSNPDLRNRVAVVINNIASLKDGFKKWCKLNRNPFDAEEFLTSNRAAALVHDLWNSGKHFGLDRKPRSGITPKIVDLCEAVQIYTGAEAGDAVRMTYDNDGNVIIQTTGSGGGGAVMIVTATIVDENGNVLGELNDILTAAVDAWMSAFRIAGVPV